MKITFTKYVLAAIAISIGFTLKAQTALLKYNFDEGTGTTIASTGTLSTALSLTATSPVWSTNLPGGTTGYSLDFGTNVGKFVAESSTPIEGLKGLSSFTIAGWINNRKTDEGGGGNRIVSWINNGGDGVDLVYHSNGSLQIAVNQWPDVGTPLSSADVITTDPDAGVDNWVFFAVTYNSGEAMVRFYIGNSQNEATLDTETAYDRGVTGQNIGKLAFGHFNDATRNDASDRMLRGLLDNIAIFNSDLSVTDIVTIQNGGSLSSIPVTGISVSPATEMVYVGAITHLTATLSPSNATNQTVTWSSSNSSIASVNSGGIVTGVSAGTATITATTQDGTYTASSSITVDTNPDPNAHTIELVLNGDGWGWVWSFEYYNGTSWTKIDHNDASISYFSFGANGNNHESNTTGAFAKFWFSGTGIRLYGEKHDYGGTGKIYIDGVYKQDVSFNAASGEWNIVIYEFYTNIAASGVAVSPTSASVNAAETTQLTATFSPSNASNQAVTWSSSNSSIASVNSSGLVRGVAAGTVTITATTQDGTYTATASITVVPNPNAHTIKLVLNGDAWGWVNSFEYYNGTEWTKIGHNDASISYSGFDAGSSNHESQTLGAYAEFSFIGTGIRLYGTRQNYGGTGKIYIDGVYKQDVSFNAAAEEWDIVVYEFSTNVAVTGVAVSPTSASVNAAETTQLTATFSPSNASNQAVTWSSSNSSIASVNSSGLVRGIAAGTATITATTQDGEKTATASITVVPIPNAHTIKLVLNGDAWGWVNSFEYYNGTSWTKTGHNDASISYSGFDAGSSNHESQTLGAYAEFSFIGIGIRLYGTRQNYGGTGKIYIDGVYKQDVSFNAAAEEWDIVVYEFNTDPNTYIKLAGTEYDNIASDTEGGPAAFDGNTTTFVDAKLPNGSYIGLDLNGLTRITKIRFLPRTEWAARMNGGKFQGSNDSINFTNIYTINNAVEGWTEVLVNADCRFVRYLSPNGSWCNVNEIEYYRTEGLDPVVVPVQSVSLGNTSYSVEANQKITVQNTILPENATDKRFTYSFVPVEIASINPISGEITGLAPGTGTITVTTTDGGKTATSNLTVTAATEVKLTGTVFSKTINVGDTIVFDGTPAFDGNINTFLDGYSITWVGLDLGSSKSIYKIKYFPRAGWSSRMIGGKFQGSNDGVTYSKMSLVNITPAEGKWTTVLIDANTNNYRYVRYLGPADGYGNVAEIEFWSPIGSTTGLTNQALENVRLYPNPVNDILSLSVNADKIIIIGIDGKVLLTTKGHNVDVSSLTKGIYFVKYFVGESTGVSKIIKR